MKPLSLLILAFSLLGCATLSPTEDPLVVRTEQVERVAFDTFDTYVKLVARYETKVKATAPAAYDFAEWLRAKGPDGKPRGIAMVKSLDATRRAYKANRSEANRLTLSSSLAALERALSEAQSHLVTVQTP